VLGHVSSDGAEFARVRVCKLAADAGKEPLREAERGVAVKALALPNEVPVGANLPRDVRQFRASIRTSPDEGVLTILARPGECQFWVDLRPAIRLVAAAFHAELELEAN
jgi:hypothetical protein